MDYVLYHGYSVLLVNMLLSVSIYLHDFWGLVYLAVVKCTGCYSRSCELNS